jgi:hypothetical protein
MLRLIAGQTRRFGSLIAWIRVYCESIHEKKMWRIHTD